MARLKTFLKYVIWVVLFFIFSQIMIYISINTTYKNKDLEINTPLIKTAEVQATSINGFARCKILNNTQNEIENKYIKIDCYSRNNVLMGTKYIKVDKIVVNEEKEFDIRFNFSRVDKAKIDMVNEISKDATEEQKNSDPEMNLGMIIAALILLIHFG